MVGHVLAAVEQVQPQPLVAVVGHQRDQVGPHIQALVTGVLLAVQEEQQGTGHAVRIAMEAVASNGSIKDRNGRKKTKNKANVEQTNATLAGESRVLRLRSGDTP